MDVRPTSLHDNVAVLSTDLQRARIAVVPVRTAFARPADCPALEIFATLCSLDDQVTLLPPNISMGMAPDKCERSSSTACAVPDRLFTVNTISRPSVRVNASVDRALLFGQPCVARRNACHHAIEWRVRIALTETNRL